MPWYFCKNNETGETQFKASLGGIDPEKWTTKAISRPPNPFDEHDGTRIKTNAALKAELEEEARLMGMSAVARQKEAVEKAEQNLRLERGAPNA